MIILLKLEYIWEEPWRITREVIGTAHDTVGPPEEKISQIFIAPSSH